MTYIVSTEDFQNCVWFLAINGAECGSTTTLYQPLLLIESRFFRKNVKYEAWI